jgi:two-component system sensor histidine kinase YesM
MKNRVRDGEVHIKMRFEDSIFYFTVEDNGPGMTAEELARVKKRMEEGRIEEEEIHALSNTNIRLKLHYGVNSGLYFENRQEGGFRVTARIQLTEEKYV